jgi:hypothetical protein
MTSLPSLSSVQSVQRKLRLDDSPSLVLATISDARRALPGHDEDDITLLIEENVLLAWDISLRPGDTARELRILPHTIDRYARAGSKSFSVTSVISCKKSGSLSNPFSATWPSLLLGRHQDKPFLFATTIRLLLNCGATHVTNLVDAGSLVQLTGTEYRRGPNGAACIERGSFLTFLKGRAC